MSIDDGDEPDLQPHVYLSRIRPAEIQIYNLAGSPLMERLSDERTDFFANSRCTIYIVYIGVPFMDIS